MTDDSSIITIVYDMVDDFGTTRETNKTGTNDTANSPKPPKSESTS